MTASAWRLPENGAVPRAGTFFMIALLARHWRHYLAEALGLGFFMLGASVITTQLRYPQAWLHQYISTPFAQLVCLGAAMVFVVLAIIYSPLGNKSGAHINPAVTLGMWRLGKIETGDALFYIASQFIGGIGAVQLCGLFLGRGYTKFGTDYVVTHPGPRGPTVAFVAEWIITFVLMMTLMWALSDAKREKYAGVMLALLIGFYLVVEEPFSGMSMNPARSFASAWAARQWTYLWIYFVAPISATLTAAELFRWMTGGAKDLSAHPKDKDKDENEAERTKTPQEQGSAPAPAS